MKFFRFSLLLLAGSMLFNACVKQKYDTSPDTSMADPNLAVSTTLSSFAPMAFDIASGKGRLIGDSTISGVVVGNDRTGNIYKQIIIQDASGGGIALLLDKSYLYGEYPVGRKIYVKLKGLTLANYNGLPEVIYGYDNAGKTVGIPTVLIGNYIVKASYPNIIKPAEVTVIDLLSNPNKYLNTLVMLKNMEFANGSQGVAYSSVVASTSRTISDCPLTGSLTMYSSSYATFQPLLTPTGKGTITGVFSMYNTPQFLIRDTSDVQLTGIRDCP